MREAGGGRQPGFRTALQAITGIALAGAVARAEVVAGLYHAGCKVAPTMYLSLVRPAGARRLLGHCNEPWFEAGTTFPDIGTDRLTVSAPFARASR